MQTISNKFFVCPEKEEIAKSLFACVASHINDTLFLIFCDVPTNQIMTVFVTYLRIYPIILPECFTGIDPVDVPRFVLRKFMNHIC